SGAARRKYGPCPGLRPGRLGLALGCPLEKGAACRPCQRFSCSISARNSAISRCCSRIRAISSSRLRSFRGASGDKRWAPFAFLHEYLTSETFLHPYVLARSRSRLDRTANQLLLKSPHLGRIR